MFECLIYQIQFLDQLNLLLVQNLKYQCVLYLSDKFFSQNLKDQL